MVCLVAALAAAGIAVNVLLLGYADPNEDPVGTLTPRATLTDSTATATRPAATATTATRTGESDGEHDDDGSDD